MLRRLWLLGFLALTALCLPAQQALLNQGEYFWDSDPGQGNGIAFPAADGNLDEVIESLRNGSITLPASNGAHTFNARVKDVYNTWSPVFTVVVYRNSNSNSARSLHISQAEYFWDSDPGQGNGSPLLALDGNLDEAVESLLQTGITLPASNGAHSFNIRVRDVDNQWSPIFSTLVHSQANTTASRDMEVVQAEYFWDSDPGQGNASPLLALDGNLDETIESILGNSLGIPAAVGPHSFNLRVKDHDNQWSSLFSTVVVQDTLSSSPRPLAVSVAEYFWDVDPGQGNGNLIIALDGNLDESIESLLGNNLILPANNGAHSFNIRVRDADNQWSPLFSTLVWRDSITGISRQMRIVQAEYFWDVDPGQGSANPLLALDGNLDESLETLFENGVILPANNGPHTFNLRVKEVDNAWSPLFTTLVVRDSLTAVAGPHSVTQGEYFWNSDPGPGNGQPMLAVDGNFDQSLEEIFQIISPSGLPPGPNALYIRVKGSDGVWGPVFGSVVSTSSPVFNADSIGGPKVFCGEVASTPLTYFADTVGGSTYTWTVQNGSLLSGQGSDSVRVQWSASGPWQLYVEGCNGQTCDTLFLDIIVNPLPQITAGHNDSICPGLGSQLMASSTTPPLSYEWTPNTGLSSNTVPNPVASPSITTTYTLTVTDTNGCQNSDSLSIHVFPAAIANAGPDSLICIGDSLQLNGSGGLLYSWTPAGSLSNPAIANPFASPATTTTYSLSVTDANGCTDDDQVTVSVSNGPNVNAGANLLICIGDTAQLSVSGAQSYTWSPVSGLSDPNIANPLAFPDSSTTYTVVGTDANGCSNTDQVTVTVAPLPVVSISPDTSICLGQSVQLSASGGNFYTWSPATGLNNSNIANPTASPLSTTLYTVTVRDGNGCEEKDSLFLTVNPLPPADAGLDTLICSGDSVQLLASGGLSYLWSPGNSLSDSSISNPFASPIFTTQYSLTVTDANGCQNFDTVRVEIEVCDSNSVDRRVTQAEYFWDTDPGQGSATPLLASDGNFDQTVEGIIGNGIQMPVTTGPHSFNVRVLGTDGNWGPLFSTLVERLPLTGISRDMAVIQAEYFWDTDPGQGNGNTILALDGNLDETVESLLNSSVSLPASLGPHLFGVRVKDIDNQWGPLFSTMVQRQELTTVIRDIEVAQAEYFWDSDPGQGNGISMLAFDGNYDESVELIFENAVPISLTSGPHTFNVRIQDADNQWSAPFSTVIYCDSLHAALRNIGITEAEYFWDSDPGQGSGTPLLALDGNIDDVVESLLRNSIGLPAAIGAHVFHVRVKDSDNQWSQTFQTLVYRDTITPVNRDFKVTMAEYFWNSDPGQGNGLPLLALDGNIDDAVESLLQSPINLPVNQGPHLFNLRVKDVDNQWSSVFQTLVWRDSVTVGNRDLRVSMAEYFWDVDPGQGNGLPMFAFDGNLDETVETLLNNPVNIPVAIGPHSFNIRVKDIDNQWSPVFTSIVHRDSLTVGTRPVFVTMAEYFWNTDPGQGMGQPILALDGNFDESLETVTAQINVTTLPPGPNVFNVRVKGADNVWGPLFRTVVDIDSNLFVGPDTIYGPNEFCGQIPAQPLYYTADTLGANTYTWSVTGGSILSGQGSDSVRVQWNPSGPYSLSLETCDAFSFCDTLVQVVVVHPLPTAQAGADTSVCQGQSVQLNASGGVAFLWSPSSSLNDDDIPNPIASPSSTTQYIVTVFDANGCSDMDTLLLTVLPPAAANAGPDVSICLGDTIQLNGSGGLTYSWAPSSSLSNPSIANPLAFPLLTTTYTLTVQNAQGCTGTDQVTVSIDDSPPVITCPANISVNNDPGLCSAVVSFPPVTGTDNCPGATTAQSAGLPSNSVFPLGTTTQTFVVTDASGRQDSCSFTISVLDAENPAITCPSDTSLNNNSGVCSAVFTYNLPLASDNCPGVTVSLQNGLASGSAFPLGQSTLNFRATDASGNSSNCSFQVTVIDNEAPNITCPTHVLVTSDPGQCGANVSYVPPIGSDNCPGASTMQIAGIGSGGFFPLGNSEEVYQVSDVAGNRDTCSFTVSVRDGEAPQITCPAPINLVNDPGQCSAVASYSPPTATDNCPGPFVQFLSGLGSGSAFPVGISTETYVAIDSASNRDTCSFTVTVLDNEAPVISCPAAITLPGDTGSCGTAVSYTPPVGSDNCPNPVTSLISGFASGAVFPVGTTNVVYEVTDNSGNTASCSFTVLVIDTVPPTLICPAPIVVNAGSGNCDQQVFYNLTAFDNCPGDSLVRTGGLGSGAIFPVGTTLESYLLLDANSNRDSCIFAIIVQDTQAPAISCPPDISRNVDPGQCGANVLYGAPTAGDNCANPNISLVSGLPTGGFFPVGTTVNVFVASDSTGNTDSCTVSVTVIDNEDPQITCPANISVNASQANCSATVNFAAPTFSDNCPGVTLSQSSGLPSGGIFPAGSTLQTFLATDAGGNNASCSFTVTVVDSVLPQISCPGLLSVNNDLGSCQAVVSYTPPSGSDNCPGAITSQIAGLGPGQAFPVGNTLESYEVIDANGNRDTCSFTVRVIDAENPQISCPSNIIVGNAPGRCDAVVSYTAPIGTDNCPAANTGLSSGLGSNAVFPVGVNNETYTVTDAAGNTAQCTFSITVEDREAPQITCPTDTTLQATAVCAATYSYSIPVASDNCSGTTVLQTSGLGSGASFPVGITVESYTATDSSGNTGSCSFSVTVIDIEAPVITCPANIVVGNAAGSCEQQVLHSASASDNCPGVVTNLLSGLSSGANFPVGISTVSYEAIDAYGNRDSCSFTVTITDTSAPQLTCPPNLNLANDPGQCGAIATWNLPTINDNCPGASLSLNGLPLNSQFPLGSTVQTYVVTDAGGNQDSCSFTVTVNDAEPPTLACPADTLIVVDSNSCSYTLGDYTSAPGTVLANSGLDYSGNQGQDNWEYGFYLAFQPQNFTQLNPANFGPIWFGNESFATPFLDPNGGHPGVNSFAWAVRRWTSNFTGSVTVSGDFFDRDLNCGDGANVRILVDGTPVYDYQSIPSTSVPYQISLNVTVGTVIDFAIDPRFDTGCDDTHFSAVIQSNFGAVANDNCSSVSLSSSPAPGTVLGPGVTTVTLTATDSLGNASSCDFDITVADTLAPLLSCPSSQTVPTDSGSCGAIVSFALPSASDNCPGVSLTHNNSFTSGSFFPVGQANLSYTATDSFGNSSTCNFSITVIDTIPPTLSCPVNISVNTDPGQCSAVVNHFATYSDNCFFVTRSQTAGLPSGSAFPVGTTLNTYLVSDFNGNSDSCSFTVSVFDSLPPVLVCPASLSVNNDLGVCGAVVNYSPPMISDNCPGVAFSQSQGFNSGVLFPIGTTLNTFVAVDTSGNTDSCSFSVTVLDTELPIISCPANIVVMADSANCTATVNYQSPVGTDNCPGAVTNQISGLGSGAVFSAGLSIETYVATDVNGNTDSCSFTITVTDSTPPVIFCNPDIVVNASPASCSAVVNYTAPSAQDNCSSGGLNPISTLTLGDIAFTSYKSDNPDFFTFVLFKDLAVGTQITFTDRGWMNTDNFRAGEGSITWTATSILAAGTEIQINGNNTASHGSVSITGPFGIFLSPNGDQLFAYQGTEPSGSNLSGFLAALQMDGAWTTNATNGSNSSKPAVFTDGVNSIGPAQEYDNYVYTCVLSQGSVQNLQSAIHNSSNWTGTDVPTGFSPASCGFIIQASANVPATQISGLGPGATFPLGTTVETWVATDGFGNNDTCSFTVQVVDAEPPTISCPANLILPNDSALCGAVVSYAAPTVSDLCGPATFTTSNGLPNGSVFPVGMSMVTYVAEDSSGNRDSCAFTITINDVATPTITCPANLTVNNDPGLCSAVVTYSPPQFSDNCPGASISLSQGLGNGGSFTVGLNLETWVVTDAAGNSDSCTFTITVTDAEAPVLACPADTIVYVMDTTGSVTVNYPLPTATENCPSGAFTQSLGLGDILFTSYKSDNPDLFSFVLLKNVAQGTEIDFTDRGWSNSNQFRAGEGSIRWTASADLLAGTEVSVFGNNTASIGTVTVTGPWGLFLSPNGDQIFAWQGNEPSGGNLSPFIAAIHVDGAWTTNATNGSNSSKPSVFTDGVNSISFPTEFDNMAYDCSVTGPGITAVRTAIGDPNNWTGSDSPTGFVVPSCGFTFPPPPAVTLNLLSGLGSGASFPTGVHTETWTASDDSGLLDTCSFTVTVLDTSNGPMAIGTGNGQGNQVGVANTEEPKPSLQLGTAASGKEIHLLKVYPNPFREEVTFRIEMPEEAEVYLQISDLSGKVIRTFRSEGKVKGLQRLIWDAKDDGGNAISAGVYIYRLRLGPKTEYGRVEYIR